MTLEHLVHFLGVCVVAFPAALLVLLGLGALVFRSIHETAIARLTAAAVSCGLLSALAILILMLATGIRDLPIELGNWVVLPGHQFHFHLKFVFDRLSVPFAILSFVLCGTVGAFTSKYLHREPGFRRFFVLYAIFLLGMIVSALGGTIETLFFGWELVGLSSALLVAFFHEHQNPVRNGQRVWAVYRIADAAFLIAALALHHLTGAGDFDALMGTGAWPEGRAAISSSHALFVGLLLLVAAAGKSALVPFSGWLPRAMEGPTPSSAVFYGSLSVHLGAYLLLRVSPLLEASFALSACVVVLGLSSAIFGALAARVQTDVKSALAFASLTQVSIIIAEIGCGLRYLPLIHMIGHACLRTLQLLRAPTLLRDYQTLENAIGARLRPPDDLPGQTSTTPLRAWWYRFALERGFLDALIDEYLIRPFVRFFRACDRLERRWSAWLEGPRPVDRTPPTAPADPVGSGEPS